MKIILPVVVLMMTVCGTAHADWVKYYKNKADGAVYFYNKDKLKDKEGVVTVWIKVDDGYPGKIDVDCNKSTYRSITSVVNEIAPDSMMDALAKIICKEKTEAPK